MTILNRPSSLDTAQFCGLSASLGESHGAGRAAAMGSAWHAIAAKHESAPRLLSGLTPEERAEVLSRPIPGDLPHPSGPLAYDAAEHEVQAIWRLDNGDQVTGTADALWTVDPAGRVGAPELVVGDLKSSRRSAPHPDRSMQLAAYGLGLCQHRGIGTFRRAIFSAEDNAWTVGEPVTVDSPAGWELALHVENAARHQSKRGTLGDHCERCWHRGYCPEYLLPPELAETSLAPLTEPGGLVTAEHVMLVSRLKKTLEVVERELKARADAIGGIPDGKGKVWKGVETAGRFSADTEALKRDGLAEQYLKQGQSFRTYRWVKP